MTYIKVGCLLFMQMGCMTRKLTHLLICLTLGLTLAVSGGQVAAARLSMALGDATLTELVICADGQVKTVRLNAEGEPVAPKSKDDCANCPDCRQVIAVATPSAAVAAAAAQLLGVQAPKMRAGFLLFFVKGSQQPRAPPKGL